MINVVKQEHVSMISITPGTIEINSKDIKVDRKDGLVIEIPENYKGILNYKVSGNGSIKEKSIFNIGRNSEIIIYEDREGELKGQGEIKIRLGKNSKLSLIEIQNLGYNSDVYLNKNIECKNNSKFNREVICLGSDNMRVDCTVHLDEDSEVNDAEVFFGNKEQKFELNTNVIHKGIRSKGNVQVRGVLKDKAYCYSHGILRINKEAQRASTFLAEHVLLLSKESKAQAIPALEIEANDVQAQHAASVTQIDGDQIFYMLTRGLTEQEARKMIVQGFLSSVLGKATEYMQEKWIKLFEEKWNR